MSGPQVQVQRHTVEQIVDAVSGLPTLDVPVPQMVDQPMALLAALDFLVPEQVIKVPKVSTPSRCPRTVLSVPQTAEQLVEAPTIVSFSSLLRLSDSLSSRPLVVEEVDVFLVFSQDRVIPSLRSRSLTIQFLVVVLVEVFTVYTQDRVLQRLVKQIIVFQQ